MSPTYRVHLEPFDGTKGPITLTTSSQDLALWFLDLLRLIGNRGDLLIFASKHSGDRYKPISCLLLHEQGHAVQVAPDSLPPWIEPYTVN